MNANQTAASPSNCTANLISQIQTSSSATAPARTPGVGADATTTGPGKVGGRVAEMMELRYVTERIIALWYREDVQGVLEHATTLLRGKHADNYMVSSRCRVN